jgi:hypothetical protein
VILRHWKLLCLPGNPPSEADIERGRFGLGPSGKGSQWTCPLKPLDPTSKKEWSCQLQVPFQQEISLSPPPPLPSPPTTEAAAAQNNYRPKLLKGIDCLSCPFLEAPAGNATLPFWRCFHNNQGKKDKETHFSRTRNINFCCCCHFMFVFSFVLFFKLVYSIYLLLLLLILSYFCFGCLFNSSQSNCSCWIVSFFIPFSISRLLISRALSYYLLQSSPLFPIMSPLFPTTNFIILNFQYLYPWASVKLPHHPPTNKNFDPIQHCWGSRFKHHLDQILDLLLNFLPRFCSRFSTHPSKRNIRPRNAQNTT